MYLRIGTKKLKLINVIIAIYCFTGMHILFMYKEVSPLLTAIRHMIVMLALLAAGINTFLHREKDVCGMVLLSTALLYIYQGVRNISDDKYFSVNSIITFIVLLYILNQNEGDKADCLNIFLDIYIFVLVIGNALTILRLVGVDLFFGDIYPSQNNVIYHHYIYSFLAVICDENPYMRFCGISNEPGVVGTVSALILVVRRYKIRDRKNIILIISGILSMSTAFFLLTIGYFVLKFLIYKPSLKKYVYTVCILVAVVIADSVLSEYSQMYSSYVHDKIERLIMHGESNRTSSISKEYVINFYSSKEHILWGYGGEYLNQMPSVIFRFLFEYGIVGCVLWLNMLMQIYLKVKKRNIDTAIFFLLYLISLYQRPYVFNAFMVLLLSAGLVQMEREHKVKKENEICMKIRNC